MATTGKKMFALRDAGGDLSKSWFVQYKCPDNGRWVKKYEGINQHTTKEGRVAAANALIAQLTKTVKPPPPNATTRAAMYSALERKRGQLRVKSFQSYHTKLNGLFDFLQGEAVNAESLGRYFQYAADTQAPGTAYDTFYTIKRILKLIDAGHMVGKFLPPKPQPEPLRYFQPHEAKRLRAHLEAEDKQLLLWCEFVYYCFLRPRSELRFLRVHHILFEEGKILVPSSIAKNKKSDYVAIPNAFAPSLEHMKKCAPNSFVFPGTQAGKPTGYNTMGLRFTELLKRLGFDSKLYGVYSWKHTGAVACVKAGISLKALQLQLRHHSLDQVDEYLRQLKVGDFDGLRLQFPKL